MSCSELSAEYIIQAQGTQLRLEGVGVSPQESFVFAGGLDRVTAARAAVEDPAVGVTQGRPRRNNGSKIGGRLRMEGNSTSRSHLATAALSLLRSFPGISYGHRISGSSHHLLLAFGIIPNKLDQA